MASSRPSSTCSSGDDVRSDLEPESLHRFQTDKKIRKRDRKTISCTSCRKRKIRCDRSKPICAACRKNNVPVHLCVYDDTPWVSAVVKEQTLKNEIAELRKANEKINVLIRKRREETEMIKSSYDDRIALLLKNNTSISLTTTPVPKFMLSSGISSDSNGKLRTSAHQDKKYEKYRSLKIDIRKMSSVKHNRDKSLWGTFGPFSWQTMMMKPDTPISLIRELCETLSVRFRESYKEQIIQKESFTSEYLNWRKVYNILNIEKRYSNLILDSNDPNKDDIFGKKLQELAKSLPPHKVVEQKFYYFFNMKYASVINKFFIQEEILDDFHRIIRKTKKGGVEINVYSKEHSYSGEMMRLAGILLFIKFGLTVSEDDDEQSWDSGNLLLKYSIACWYLGKPLVKPSLVALMVSIFYLTLKYLNPDDCAEEPYVHTTRIESVSQLQFAFEMTMALGLGNDYSQIPGFMKEVADLNDSYLSKEIHQGIWLNLLSLDYKNSLDTGSPLIVPTFKGYDKTSSSKKLNHIGMMRQMCDKYSVMNRHTILPLDRDFKMNKEDFLSKKDIEDDLESLTEYFNDNVELESKFWDNFKIRARDTLPEKDLRVLYTLEVLYLTTSLNFFLYQSYDKISDPLNVPDDDVKYTEEDMINMKTLSLQFMNNALLHACYILKINQWSLNQSVNNEAVKKNRLLEVMSFPVYKNTLIKAATVCATILLDKCSHDQYGVVFNLDTEGADFIVPENSNVFNYTLQEFDDLCFKTNVNNHQRLQFFHANFFNDYLKCLSSIYRSLKNISLIKKDIKWFAFFSEMYFISYYILQKKGDRPANDGQGKHNTQREKLISLAEAFTLEDYNKFKSEHELKFDSDFEVRYDLKFILN